MGGRKNPLCSGNQSLRDYAMPKLAQGGAASAATILHHLLNDVDAIELPDGRQVLVLPVDSALAAALMIFDPDGDADREPDSDDEPDYDDEHPLHGFAVWAP